MVKVTHILVLKNALIFERELMLDVPMEDTNSCIVINDDLVLHKGRKYAFTVDEYGYHECGKIGLTQEEMDSLVKNEIAKHLGEDECTQ